MSALAGGLYRCSIWCCSDIIPHAAPGSADGPLLVAKHQQYLKKQLKPEVDLFGQLETIKIKPCPTVGSGKAFSL